MANEGYEFTYKLLAPRLKDIDIVSAAKEKGYEVSEDGKVIATFLNRKYYVTNEEVIPFNKDSEDWVIKCLIIYYLESKGVGGPGKEFLPMGAFLPNVFRGGVDDLPWMAETLLQKYGQNAKSINNIFKGISERDYSLNENNVPYWDFKIFPKVSLRIYFYEADEEFPAEFRIFYDDNAGRYFEFEQFAFILGAVFDLTYKSVEK